MITVYAHADEIEFVSDIVELIGWHATWNEDSDLDRAARRVRIEATERDEQDTATQIEAVLVALGFRAGVTSGDPEIDFERELLSTSRRMRLTDAQTSTLRICARADARTKRGLSTATDEVVATDGVSVRTGERRVQACLARVGRVEANRLARILKGEP